MDGWLKRRATATRSRRAFAVAGGVLVLTGAAAVTFVLTSGPRPDATLHRTAVEADALVLDLAADSADWLEIDGGTLRGYESYLGLELWSAQNAFGSPCLLAVERSDENLAEVDCAPVPAELFIDVSSFGDSFDRFPGEGIIRFFHRGDTVEAYVHHLRRAE